MSHTTKSTVQCHLDSKKHQVAVETMQKREKARVERRLEAEADALPHKAAMRQPSLQSVVASCNDKNKAADDTVFAFAGAGIPLDKLDHPLVRAWLQKYIGIVKIGRRGRTLWFWMLERRSATRRICPLCMRFTIASRSKE